MSTNLPDRRSFFIETLGCAKNTADSDGISSILLQAGFDNASEPGQAGVMIVNTCGFLQASRAESLKVLTDLGRSKRPGQLLIAAGCLISRYGERIRSEAPGVDGVIDAGRWLAMPRLIEYLGRHSTVLPAAAGGGAADGSWMEEAYLNLPPAQISARSVTDVLPRHATGPSAYLKIADGCDRPCSFCIIPAIKGGHRSKAPDQVIQEARELIGQGVRELVLVAQDTTAYGWDLKARDQLAPLLERIASEVEGVGWIRLMYAYPGHVTPRLIQTMAALPQVVKYIDVPLQHAAPSVLTRMKRPNAHVTLKMLDDLRTAMPSIAVRTTFIVGFPGETESEFENLLLFMEQQKFDRVGVFEYSLEEGTPAFALPGQVKPKQKKRRREAAMKLQQSLSAAKNRSRVGETLEVLVEGAGDGVSIGRSYRDAPEVDGVVIIRRELSPGTFARVKVASALEYDLIGDPA